MHFYIDARTHSYRKDSLINPALAAYQGPSLLAFNDAQFSPTDWQSIRKPQQSMKRDDPLKVGKFGIGFNSIYHITGNNEFHLPEINVRNFSTASLFLLRHTTVFRLIIH